MACVDPMALDGLPRRNDLRRPDGVGQSACLFGFHGFPRPDGLRPPHGRQFIGFRRPPRSVPTSWPPRTVRLARRDRLHRRSDPMACTGLTTCRDPISCGATTGRTRPAHGADCASSRGRSKTDNIAGSPSTAKAGVTGGHGVPCASTTFLSEAPSYKFRRQPQAWDTRDGFFGAGSPDRPLWVRDGPASSRFWRMTASATRSRSCAFESRVRLAAIHERWKPRTGPVKGHRSPRLLGGHLPRLRTDRRHPLSARCQRRYANPLLAPIA